LAGEREARPRVRSGPEGAKLGGARGGGKRPPRRFTSAVAVAAEKMRIGAAEVRQPSAMPGLARAEAGVLQQQ
jgi:hypothetical protein